MTRHFIVWLLMGGATACNLFAQRPAAPAKTAKANPQTQDDFRPFLEASGYLARLQREIDEPEHSVEEITRQLDELPPLESTTDPKMEQRYNTELKNVVKAAQRVGETTTTFPGGRLPFTFAQKNGQPAIGLTLSPDRRFSDRVSGLSDPKLRAAMILRHYLLPVLMKLPDSLEKTPFAYYAAQAVYGAYLPAEKRTKGELLTVIAPKENCVRFSKGEMTDVEFIAGAETYIWSGDLGSRTVKIKPELD